MAKQTLSILVLLGSIALAAGGCSEPSPSAREMVSNRDGTPIGNLTSYGGLTASFDNKLTKVATSCSAPPGGVEVAAPLGYNNFIGKDWGSGIKKTIVAFRLFPPANQAMMQTAAIDLKLQGSNDNVAWTDLYIGKRMAPGAVPNLTVRSGIDASAGYRFHRVSIRGNGINSLVVCQLQFAEQLSSP